VIRDAASYECDSVAGVVAVVQTGFVSTVGAVPGYVDRLVRSRHMI